MEIPPAVLRIMQTLRDAGHTALLAGGCVRDALLGREAHDWDIATSAAPDAVQALFPKTVAVGKSFGVIVVVTDAGEFEVATFRTDGDYRDGRRPTSVCFSTPEADAARRDFTVNALFYDPFAREVRDYVGGRADLERKTIRAVGDPVLRFQEDHLRLLRAVRFAARLGFTLDPATARAAAELAPTVKTVSAERVAAELTRIFSSPGAERGFRLLEELGLLREVLPEAAALRGVAQPPEFHPEGDVFEHTALMLRLREARAAENPEAFDGFSRQALGWAVVLHDIAKPATAFFDGRWRFNEHDVRGAEMAAGILERLKMPTRFIETVRALVIRHMHFINIGKMREAKRRRFLQDPLFPLHLELHYLDCAGSHNLLENYEYAKKMWREEMARPQPGPRLIGGTDLIALGFRPGARFKEILTAVEDAALEGEITTPADARAWVLAHYPPDGK